ncbi:MAG: hypothetical protein K2W96_09240, partial [Gemmataceae bacterium]|nr:hypothetical protein [Gemmataceae bacterium]
SSTVSARLMNCWDESGNKANPRCLDRASTSEFLAFSGMDTVELASNTALCLEIEDGLEKLAGAGLSPTGLLPAVALAG